jgi:hypothetical protein
MDLPEELRLTLFLANEIANRHDVYFRVEKLRYYDNEKKERLVAERLHSGITDIDQRTQIMKDILENVHIDMYRLTREAPSRVLVFSVSEKCVVLDGSLEATKKWLQCWMALALEKNIALSEWEKWIAENPDEFRRMPDKSNRWIRAWNVFDG